MVRGIFIFWILLIVNSGNAQEDYIQPGLLKATATISPSMMLNRGVNNIYISGFLEYHLDKKLSLRGETFVFVDAESRSGTNNLLIDQGMRTYFGVFYHFNKNNWDKYLGFQPGVALMKPISNGTAIPEYQVCPSIAFHVGTTYYVWKYFSFFADLAYVNSTLRGLQDGPARSDELILSAGLGFQIQTKRK